MFQTYSPWTLFYAHNYPIIQLNFYEQFYFLYEKESQKRGIIYTQKN